MISQKTVVVPNEATNEHLLMVHKKKYLKSLKVRISKSKICKGTRIIVFSAALKLLK